MKYQIQQTTVFTAQGDTPEERGAAYQWMQDQINVGGDGAVVTDDAAAQTVTVQVTKDMEA